MKLLKPKTRVLSKSLVSLVLGLGISLFTSTFVKAGSYTQNISYSEVPDINSAETLSPYKTDSTKGSFTGADCADFRISGSSSTSCVYFDTNAEFYSTGKLRTIGVSSINTMGWSSWYDSLHWFLQSNGDIIGYANGEYNYIGGGQYSWYAPCRYVRIVISGRKVINFDSSDTAAIIANALLISQQTPTMSLNAGVQRNVGKQAIQQLASSNASYAKQVYNAWYGTPSSIYIPTTKTGISNWGSWTRLDNDTYCGTDSNGEYALANVVHYNMPTNRGQLNLR